MGSAKNEGNPMPQDKSMDYGMLGDDDTSSSEKLEKYTGTVSWEYLKPHFQNEALIYVDPSLSIIEVGEAFTKDDSSKVAAWRESGEILAPSQPHADFWERSEALFAALVVSPFVLIQPSAD